MTTPRSASRRATDLAFIGLPLSAWIVELLIVRATPADVVRPDAMLLTVTDHRPPASQRPAVECIDHMLADARSRLLSFEGRVAELEAQRAAALQRLSVAQE